MRLQAAFALLHLSTIEVFANAITPKFLRLAVTVQVNHVVFRIQRVLRLTLSAQDSCYNVRMEFVTKLVTLLQPRKLPPRYNVIPFLTVHDPEDDVKSLVCCLVCLAQMSI